MSRTGLLCLLLVAVVGFVTASRRRDVGDWTPPEFCRGLDCPKFEVVQSISELELRKYEPGKWITTNVSGKAWSDASSEGYKTLDDYRGGNNKEKTKVQETVPYFTLFYPVGGEDKKVKDYYTIEYFVPHELQERPPSPTSESVNWVNVDEQNVWIQTFGGYASEEDIINRAFDLSAQLKQQGHKVEDQYFGFAQYDPAIKVIARHNEIWVFSRDEEPSPSK